MLCIMQCRDWCNMYLLTYRYQLATPFSLPIFPVSIYNVQLSVKRENALKKFLKERINICVRQYFDNAIVFISEPDPVGFYSLTKQPTDKTLVQILTKETKKRHIQPNRGPCRKNSIKRSNIKQTMNCMQHQQDSVHKIEGRCRIYRGTERLSYEVSV